MFTTKSGCHDHYGTYDTHVGVVLLNVRVDLSTEKASPFSLNMTEVFHDCS